MPKTIVLSDCHLGYDGFNKKEFKQLLDHFQSEGRISRLVLLGDILDLWRIDPVKSFSVAQEYLESLHQLAKETYYVVGNHDYHVRSSCLVSGLGEKFAWTIAYHPYLVDGDLFFVHGDYFDIYQLPIWENTVYAVYEAIYHMDKSMVASLEGCFWNPIKLLREWIRLYRKSPARARSQPLAEYLSAVVNVQKRSEIAKLNRGVKYLSQNPNVAVQMFVPTSMRDRLPDQLPTLLSRTAMREIDTAPRRSLLSKRNVVDLAREISGNMGISRVIFGHTHKAESNPSKSYWNTGAWVDGESTFAEIEDGQVQVYRLKQGQKVPIAEEGRAS